MNKNPHSFKNRIKNIISPKKRIIKKEDAIVVFSHLRWEFVTQRPQHIISRLAKDRKVIFIEEPIAFSREDRGTYHEIKINRNLSVIQPRISWDYLIQEIYPITTKLFATHKIKKPVLWFYSPLFSPLISLIDHSLVVFDCMDELKSFKNPHPQLLENERFLLKEADIIFTGGKSLYESKRQFSQNVYCFPSSVDTKHFEKALHRNTEIPDEIASLQKPIVGFYGVVDERLDLDLLDRIAQKMPHVSFVIIGPVVKIDPSALPARKNLHYLGPRPYNQLPQYLKAFSIAMMPFALNESTRFISPTKTLEFMAALKPIVSTPIVDVVRDYQKQVKVVKSAEEFKKAIEYYLHEKYTSRVKRFYYQQQVIIATSWDKTVEAMKDIMDEKLYEKAKQLEQTKLPSFKIADSLVYE